MEIIGINVCRTCLGKLEEVPRNLLEANFTDVLDVLRGFVADLADFRTDGVFNVCSFCYEKLDYICKFKKQCQKSFDDYMEIKNKKVSLSEDSVVANLGQIIDDDYLSAKIELDSENLEETITIYKNSEETKSTAMGPLEPTMEPPEPTMEPLEPTIIEPIISSARRGSRAKQFPTSDVLVAIDECTSYQTDLKNRKCIHCDHLAKINRQLCIHMKYKHAEEVRTWCSRCNTQTNDLEEHLKATRCCEYVCKFCNKKCRRLFMLMAHLKSHAFEHFAAQSKKAKISSQQEISEHKALVFPPREDSQQEKSLQQLSNVVFQYDNTVVDAVIKMESTTIESSTNIATADGKIKASRISKQYDSALVLQALAQCTNYLRNMKNRICGQCSVVTTLSTGLNNHMLRTHSKLYPLWCNRCNVQTEDLQAHKDLVKCNTYSCKFCDKEFNKLNKLSKHLQCHCHEIFRNKATVDEEPTIQTQSFTSTSASNDQQRSGDGTPVPETTDGNITYENSQGFFFAEVNASASANISYENNHKVLTEPADVVKMDDNFDNTDGTMTYEISENTDGNITYESLENTTDGKFSYEIKQETPEDTEMLTEITGSDNMEDPRDDSNVQDTTVSADDDSVSDECTDDDSEDSSHGDGPGWSLLDQVDPADVVRALMSVRKPVLVHSKCIICNSAMTDNRGLSLHMTIVHKDEREKWCRTCNDLFDDLNEHKEIHAPKCEFCNKTFRFTSHLRSHLKNHARNDNFHTSTWITCKACSNIFPDEDLLSAHECTPDPSKVDHIKCRTFCALCNEAVPVLKYHMKEKHNADGASDTFHLCSACGKSFTSTYQLNIHMRKHTGELPYKCVHCDKSFAARHLMAHHEKLHTDGKLNVCHICSRPFATNAQLECHLMTHTGKTIKCSQCDKSFCFKAQLTAHMRQHTGEKPHLCTDCGRGFYNKTALASHSRHTHSEDRPYKCSYCDSSFKVKATLKTHEFIHTGLKPFKCTECPYSCRQSYRLTIHMKQHLDENKTVHTCMFCKERFTTHLHLISHTYAHHGEMPLDQLNHLNNLNTPTTTTTPNVVNITSHHIIIPDGNNAQTIQIAGADMLVGGQVICMDSTSRGDMPVNQLGLERMGADDSMDGNIAMDEIDNVPIQIVYKPQEMG